MYQNIVINFACTHYWSLNQIFVKFKQLEKKNHNNKGQKSIGLIKPILSSKNFFHDLIFLPEKIMSSAED